MPEEDARRWNRRYRGKDGQSFRAPRPLLLTYQHLVPAGARVLDVACGMGGNAAPLLDRGCQVVGVDISIAALRLARLRFPHLQAVLADLTELRFPARSFAAVLNFYYLDRELWPEYTRLLQPGGLLIIETLTREMLTLKPEIEPRFLLDPGELLSAFSGWHILHAAEGWQTGETGHRRHVAGLVARSPL